MIVGKIDVKKIDKDLLYHGEKATYLDFSFRDKPNDYSDGFIVQSVSKEKRERGEKGPIIGSWKHMESKSAPKHATNPSKVGEDNSLPF